MTLLSWLATGIGLLLFTTIGIVLFPLWLIIICLVKADKWAEKHISWWESWTN
jgi:hypothetical protein